MEAPKHNGNDLSSVISWINNGDYVVLHSPVHGCSRFFHSNCENSANSRILETNRVIYIDVTKIPGLCDDGEWEYYIKSSSTGVDCTCNLKNIVSKSDDARVLHPFFLKI